MNKKIKKIILKIIPNNYRYRIKENYITSHDISWWKGHINMIVLEDFNNYITGDVLDIGCNHGPITILAGENRNILSITGIDRNKKALSIAEKMKNEQDVVLRRKVSFKVENFNELSFQENKFDSAFMLHVLEHIYPKNRKSIFDEIKRVLKPNGFLLIAVPYGHAYDDGIQHVAFFNQENLKQTIEELGFNVLSCERDRREDIHTPEGHDCINLLCQNKK